MEDRSQGELSNVDIILGLALIQCSVLKTGSPEILREEHDTIISESIARGETYRTQLKEDEEEIMASIGVDVEMLRPGEAVNGHVGKRRRGWKEEGIRDWTRPLIGAK